MRERELSRRIRQFLRLGSGDVQTLVGGQAYNPQNVAITGGTVNGTNVPYVLARSFVAVAVPADVTLDTLVTVPVPAGAMGANGFLEIEMGWSWTSSTNAKTPTVVLGSTTLWNPSGFSTTTGFVGRLVVGNQNNAASQKAPPIALANGGYGTTTLTIPLTAAENTANALNLIFKGQKASAGETMQLEWYIVRVAYSA